MLNEYFLSRERYWLFKELTEKMNQKDADYKELVNKECRSDPNDD